MGAEGAAEIVFKKEIDSAKDKSAKRKEMIEEYREAFANPYVAAGRRLVDDIIEPAKDAARIGPSSGIPAYQARIAAAEEAWTDSVVRIRG